MTGVRDDSVQPGRRGPYRRRSTTSRSSRSRRSSSTWSWSRKRPKTVPVRVNRIGTQPQGFVVASEQANPQDRPRHRRRQPRSSSSRAPKCDVNLTGLRVNIQQQYPLTPRDASGADMPRLRLEPDTAEIRIDHQSAGSRPCSCPFRSQTPGHRPRGLQHRRRRCRTASSSRSRHPRGPAGAILGLITEPIDVSGQRTDITRSVALRVPAGRARRRRDNVTVTIRIRPTPGETRPVRRAPGHRRAVPGCSARFRLRASREAHAVSFRL